MKQSMLKIALGLLYLVLFIFFLNWAFAFNDCVVDNNGKLVQCSIKVIYENPQKE